MNEFKLPKIPQVILDKMSPEVRARYDAIMSTEPQVQELMKQQPLKQTMKITPTTKTAGSLSGIRQMIARNTVVDLPPIGINITKR